MLEQIETQVAHIERDDPAPEMIALAADVLQSGGLVAFPTETVYGLGANALSVEAVARIFAAKERPANDPIIVHIHETEQLNLLARSVPDIAFQLAEAFWPGPLTLILQRSDRVPDNITAGRKTVAIRMPSHPVALALLQTSGLPIGAPSANRFSRPSPTSAAHVIADLGGRVDVVLDAGSTDIGVESTIVDLTGNLPLLRRAGGIPLEALVSLLPELQDHPEYLPESSANVVSPGSLLRHYAPQARLLLFEGPEEAVVEKMRAAAQRELNSGQGVGILAIDDQARYFEDLPVRIALLGHNEIEMAARLFAALRELDQAGVDIILASTPPISGLGRAVRDRLIRAAEGHIQTIQR